MVRNKLDDEAKPVPSGLRTRTRTAIMAAALALWSRDFATPLSEIAARAEVSRSTLHRYFPERQDLVDALLLESLHVLDSIARAAADNTDTAFDHLIYLLRSFVEVGDRVVFLFADPGRFTGNPHWSDTGDVPLRTLITAAQTDGDLDPDLPAEWLEGVFNAHIYVSADTAQRGGIPAHAIADAAVRTLLNGIGAPRRRTS
ncbi:TetR/AcrR family transcriptional regulator [Nocardia sp. NPDC058176]|uniref:TetR/AcrR family transcriptional regulator n=1 Tax=Nocardia sp. NPDC058176 TaxID=3346368 RepID=UPI0036D89CBF